jgi:thioredoxin-related protein
MKHLKLSLLALLLFPFSALAGGDAWLTDLEEAKKVAKKENKAILIDFTGSDWCHWCIILKKEVFSKEEFLEAAKKDFVLVELDFPRKSEQSPERQKTNKALAKKYEIKGYPTVLLTDATGKVFARTGYQEGGVEPYLAHLKKALERKELH